MSGKRNRVAVKQTPSLPVKSTQKKTKVDNSKKSTTKSKKVVQEVQLSPLATADKAVEGIIDNLDLLYDTNATVATDMIETIRVLYDHSKENENSEFAVKSALSNLLVDGFEAEQIWEQLKLQYDPLLKAIDDQSDRFISIMDESNDVDFDDDDEDMEDVGILPGDNIDDDEFDEDMLDDGFDIDEHVPITKKKVVAKSRVMKTSRLPKDLSSVEDGFFNWEDMHKFADEGEFADDVDAKKALLEQRRKNMIEAGEIEEDEEDEGEEEDVDIFGDIIGDNDARYDDFFLPPSVDEHGDILDDEVPDFEGDIFGSMYGEGEGTFDMYGFEGEGDGEMEDDSNFGDLMADDEEMNIPEDYIINDEEHVVDHLMTPFESRQAKLQKQIETIEQQLLGPKSWDVVGETQAHKRELDALLDKDLDFQFATRAAEPITDEVAEEIEAIIRARIKDEAWDDVTPRIPPPEKLFNPVEELSVEKSKYGLAEVYEKEYLQMALGTASDAQSNLTKEHEEITSLFSKLCRNLDSLSNFHFTPKSKNIELEITSSAPAIQMEEVLPMAVSDAIRAAPQEMFSAASRGLIASREEQTKSEKDSARRNRRDRKRKHFDHEEEKTKLAAAGGDEAAKSKLEQKSLNKDYQEATRSKKVARLEKTDETKYSTSSTFFQKIQEDSNREKSGVKISKKKADKSATAGSYMH